MISFILLQIGLVLTPFYEVIVKLFPYAQAMVDNTREAKQFLGMWLALAIGLTALYSGQIKRCTNKWLLLLVLFIPLSIHLAPKYSFIINGVDGTNFWVWKPFCMILAYYFLFSAISNIDIDFKKMRIMNNILITVGLVMSIYCLLQAVGVRQFFVVKNGVFFNQVTQRHIVGTLGQPTIVSPFIAMLIPFALSERKWIKAIIMVSAVLVCQSSFAILGMVAGLIVYSLMKHRRTAFRIGLISILILLMGVSAFGRANPERFDKMVSKAANSNGRFNVWKRAVNVMFNETLGDDQATTYAYTGAGLGSYSIIFRPMLKSNFKQAHNDYLETACTLGIIGLCLFLMAIYSMIQQVIFSYRTYCNNNELISLTASFTVIAIVAFGTFIWQLTPHNFYTVLVAGLLHNGNILKGV